MTTISPSPIPPFPGAASLAVGSPTTEWPAGVSFADTLLAVLDRALVETPGQKEDRFAEGTMRSSVEMFNERGFFEDRAPTEQHEPESPLASDSIEMPGVPPPTFPPGEALPLLQSDPTHIPVIVPPEVSPPVAVTTPTLASELAVDGQVAIAGPTPVSLQPGTTGRAVVSATPPPASLAPSLRAAGMIIEDPASQERAPRASLRRDPPALAASRVTVSLDHNDNGVAVSVVADVEPDSDAGAMHDAVSHMLARHGLVLSELRVTRRPGADGQDRKD